jgi:hypothetical protein
VWLEPKPLLSNRTPGYWVLPESSCHCENNAHILLRPKHRNNGEREKRLSTSYLELLIYYLRFLAFLVSGSNAPVVFMPRLLGCDFFSLHTNTQIRKRRVSSVQRFFTFATVFCVLVLSKTGFVGEYTDTHYKMTRFLFMYL